MNIIQIESGDEDIYDIAISTGRTIVDVYSVHIDSIPKISLQNMTKYVLFSERIKKTQVKEVELKIPSHIIAFMETVFNKKKKNNNDDNDDDNDGRLINQALAIMILNGLNKSDGCDDCDE